MPNDAYPSPRRARAAARPILALALAAIFVLIARQIEPAGSLAGEAGDLGDPAPQPAPAQKAYGSKRPSLGVLTGRDYRIEVTDSPEGPRYSVFDEFGELLADELLADDVYRAVPNLDLTTLFADGSLMMVDELPEP